MNEPEIRNLVQIVNEQKTKDVLKKIHLGECVMVSMKESTQVMHENIHLFTVEACRKGNPKHNAINIFRDLMKKYHTDGNWTRGKIEPYIKID